MIIVRESLPVVMPGTRARPSAGPSTSLVPGIHVLRLTTTKTWMASKFGPARLPHKNVLQVGYVRLALTSQAMTG
jgi:hypothetical protein